MKSETQKNLLLSLTHDLRFLRSVGFLTYVLLWLYAFTIRGECTGINNLEKARMYSKNDSVIVVFWHNNLFGLFLGGLLGKFTFSPMVGLRRDGDITETIFKCFGQTPFRAGIQNGRYAIDKAVDILQTQTGSTLLIAPDGSGGPAFWPKKGSFIISKKTASPIVPLRIESSSYWEVQRFWDKSRVPKPFSKVRFSFLDPIIIEEGDIISEWELKNYSSQLIETLKQPPKSEL